MSAAPSAQSAPPRASRHPSTASTPAQPGTQREARGSAGTAASPAQAELVRQVQQALDAAMARLDVACERFRAVGDAHELRLERLGKAVDAERSGRQDQTAALLEGATRLTLKLEAETVRLQDADRILAGRLSALARQGEAEGARLNELERLCRHQQDRLHACEAALEALQQAQAQDRADQRRRTRRGRLLAYALLLATLPGLAALALRLGGTRSTDARDLNKICASFDERLASQVLYRLEGGNGSALRRLRLPGVLVVDHEQRHIDLLVADGPDELGAVELRQGGVERRHRAGVEPVVRDREAAGVERLFPGPAGRLRRIELDGENPVRVPSTELDTADALV